jgi:hypothetical protein
MERAASAAWWAVVLGAWLGGPGVASSQEPSPALNRTFARQVALNVPLRAANGTFSAGGSARPSELGPGAPGKLTLPGPGMPFSAAVARSLLPGSEVRLEGQGQLALQAGGSPRRAQPVLAGVGTASAAGSASGALTRECKVSLVVKRLDGDRVQVALSRTDSGQAAASLSGHADLTLSASALASAKVGPVAPEAVAKAQELLDGVTRWTQADVAGKLSRARSGLELKSWTLDLSQREGAKAFDELLRLDPRRAERAGSTARLSASNQERSFAVQAELGKQLSLLNWARQRSESNLVLRSSDGDLALSRVSVGETYSDLVSDLFSGRRAQSTQLLLLQRPGKPLEGFLHVRQTIQGDKLTTEADLHRFLAFAELIGAGSSRTAELRRNATSWRARYDDNFGRSSRTVDLYVTDAGLSKLAQASPERIRAAFAEAYELLDRPTQVDIRLGDLDDVWSRTPWLVREDANHGTILKLLETEKGSAGWSQADRQYRRITGRSLGVDGAAWQKSQQIVAFAGKLRAARSPAERAQEFSKLGGSLDLGKTLATIGMIAGKENLLLNELALRGERGFDLTVARTPRGQPR